MDRFRLENLCSHMTMEVLDFFSFKIKMGYALRIVSQQATRVSQICDFEVLVAVSFGGGIRAQKKHCTKFVLL